ncbi:uncharacterized protein LOC129746432 [Uranotaenia lowii]|uniref:uncharacterized protein LOC129746432 n=1 Tax=Uranotaenia lowii TaxID=190385 RepID=UPI002478D474|nr:uncharacterized protein LOC129746432 [Uranotaenia lowii]
MAKSCCYWILAAIVGVIAFSGTEASKCYECKALDCEENKSVDCTPTTEADKCFSINRDTFIERGCLKTLTVEGDKTKCSTETDLSCVTCDGDNCNNQKWRKCYSCSGNAEDCTKEQSGDTGLKLCGKYVATDQCFSKVDTDSVQRGCHSDLTEAEQTACAANKLCETCSDDSCNKLSKATLESFPKCKQCIAPTAGCEDGTIAATECGTHVDSCYVRLNGDKVERGCVSKLAAADAEKCVTGDVATTCLKCSGDDCNTQKWLKCFKCVDTDANCAAEQTSTAGFCSLFKVGNKCYERLVNAKIQRGCQTDLAGTEEACSGNQECRTCSTDACNKETAESLKTTDRCLQCSSLAGSAADKCLLGTESNQPCAKASDGECYSRIGTDGLVNRGCTSALTADEVTKCTGTLCNVCKAPSVGTTCNTGLFPASRLKCYRCKSTAADGKCQEALTGESFSEVCPKYKETDGCYSRNSGDFLERGCLSDLTEEPCKGLTEKQCATCEKENCNSISKKVLNGAGQLAALSAVAMVAVSFLVTLVTKV